MIVRSAYHVTSPPHRPTPPPETVNMDWLRLDLGVVMQMPQKVTIAGIRSRVEQFYKMETGALATRSRCRAIARPRQIAMYLARILTRQSYPTLARRFGNFDHTTVLHAVRSVERWIEEDGDFALEVETMRRRIVEG